jgi:biopolymer transport protein ExbD
MQVSDDKPYDDINITPMLDLAYVLLVIFILMTTASVQGTKVNLPRASVNSPDITKPGTKSITVNSEGRFFLDATPVSIEDLEVRLTAMKSAKPNLPIIIRGDQATQYQGIMDVLDVLGRVGLSEVGLATKQQKKS